MENGFKTCGLYPLHANSIDYSKVFRKLENSFSEILSTSNDTPEVFNEPDDLKVLKRLIDKDKLTSFRIHNSSTWKGEKGDESLYEI